MNKKILALCTLAVCGMSVWAQPRSTSAPVKLASCADGLMAPVWSPNGDKIAAAGANYAGIYVFNADGTQGEQITAAEGAGYKMTWGADGKEIFGRTNIVDNCRVFHEFKAWNVETREARTIAAKARTNAAPSRRVAGVKTCDVYETMTSDPAEAASKIAALNDYAGKIIINPALSPDGSKIAFQIVGNGMWVINADGTELRSLGKGSHASWTPDSKSIVYTVVTDNGNDFTSSTVYSMDIESAKSSVILADSKIIPLTPAVSPDGKKMVFENAADASLYIVTLNY